MISVDLPFDPWTPDLPGQENRVVKNVIPDAASFLPLPSLEPVGGNLTGTALGGYWAPDTDGNVYNYVGTLNDLYQLDGTGAWQNVNLGASGSYTSTDRWEFVKFKNLIIATNGLDPIQYINIGAYSGASAFANLGGSPPVASCMGVIRGHLVLGNLSSDPSRIQWSGWFEEETWDNSIRSQSGERPLLGRGGVIQNITSGNYGLIFQEHSIWKMTWVGAPNIFAFEEIQPQHGTPAPRSVCQFGPLTFYYSHDGFRMFDGQMSIPIGENKVDGWFLKNAATDDPLTTLYGVVDRQRRVVMWSFKSSDSQTINDRILLYSIDNQTWSYAELETQIILEYRTQGYSLETLESTGLITNIDGPLSGRPIDADLFKAGDLSIGAVNSVGQPTLFTGEPLDATVDTTETQKSYDRRTIMNIVRPLVRGGATVTVQVGGRNRLDEVVRLSSPVALNSNREAPVRSDFRYPTVRVNTSGRFEHIQGVSVMLRPGGGRR